MTKFIIGIGKGSQGSDTVDTEENIFQAIEGIVRSKVVITNSIDSIVNSVENDFSDFIENESERQGNERPRPFEVDYKKRIRIFRDKYGKVPVYQITVREIGYIGSKGGFIKYKKEKK